MTMLVIAIADLEHLSEWSTVIDVDDDSPQPPPVVIILLYRTAFET